MDARSEILLSSSVPHLSHVIKDAQQDILSGKETAFPASYKPLLDKAFEGGIRKNRTFNNKEFGEFPEAKGVELWNRNGLLYLAREYLKTHSIDTVRFLMFDISGVKQMDEAGAADYNLNIIAEATREVCSRFKDVLPLVPSRYGGDEFTVGIFGKLSDEQEKKFNQLQLQLSERITQLTLPINRGGDTVIVPVGAKFEISNPAEIEENEARGKELFQLYLDRGVILPTAEIQKMLDDIKIKILHGSSYEKEFAKIKKKDFQYPAGTQTIKQKLQYFRSIHQEYAAAFEDLEKNIETADGESRAKEYIDYMERVVYDQLLNEHVTDFADFYTHFNEGTFDTVIAIEGKFLKEANKLNYLQGDNVKLGIWESIKAHIPAAMLSKITIANRAGAFLIGIDHGKVSKAEMNELREKLHLLTQSYIAQANVEIKDKTIQIPLGIAIGETASMKTQDKHVVDIVREQADNSWHEQFIVQQLIRIEPHIFAAIINTDLYKEEPEVILETVDSVETLHYKGEYSSYHLLYHYFNEAKRGKDRRKVMNEYVINSQYIRPERKDSYKQYFFPEQLDFGHNFGKKAA